ncbi:unnamed protein product (macronuclear) [Paramecium tetraurelia]|uniref:Ras-GEF domain-containing protein n=1 Tax=Paramecium tetraurelia TaxID=5888 RepID=A0DSS4_PARTE|nr:uncharacterized protein GSPATT00019784001 [Paramecium tetraurelia]CAK86091.1 unnamed protein product [Paramecium tetraurelia]|eukprot:XP_001453488.1 hypothetical protein (macronuclear) [Paramecium tetraurelia strain d4-2]
MINEQTIQDMVPYKWPEDQDDRLQFSMDLKMEFENFIISCPKLKNQVLQTMQKISEEAPYLDLIELFTIDKEKTHKLYKVLSSLQLNNNTLIDFKQPVSNKTLQKLISDSYRLFNRSILDYQCKLIFYAKYYKTSISIFKKSINQTYIDYNTLNFVCSCATKQCLTLTRLWKDYDDAGEKYKKLLVSLQKLEVMQKPDDLTHYFNRQQLILIYTLFSLMQCEQTIAIQLGEEYLPFQCSPIDPHFEEQTEDFTWNINGFSQIRDYFPKLAHKLNKKMKHLKDLPLFTIQERIKIYQFTQHQLGYKKIDDIHVDVNLQQQIIDILNYRQANCEIELVLLVANAKCYTQILYSLI